MRAGRASPEGEEADRLPDGRLHDIHFMVLMTRRQQIGQLFMVGFVGTTVTPDWAAFLKEYRPGGIILFSRNLESIEQIVELTNQLQKLSPQSPLLISIDQEGGRVSRLPKQFTIFPPCELLGRCNSYELAYAAAAVTAAELKCVGINMNMAPVLDVNSNPNNPIIGDRAFGSIPATVCEMGRAVIAGLQENRVAACGKHFPGHGDTTADSHLELPIVAAPRHRLHEIEWPPFQHAIRHGVAAIMTAHVRYDALDSQTPATLSPAIVQQLLREDFSYKGVVLTDDLEMHAIIDHYGIGEAAVRAFQAGCDILLICKDREREVEAVQAVEAAVSDGRISAARLDASLARIAQLKARYAAPYKPANISDARLIVGCRTHRALLASLLRTADRLSQTATLAS